MNWYVVTTKPNGERTAEANLKRQGFVTYLPQMMVTRRHARRVERVKRPLFSCYLFVKLDPATARWRSINGTFGVRHILTNDGRPQAIDPQLVTALVAKEEDGVIDATTRFAVGDAVQVCGGPLDMQIGKILTADDAGRVRLLLQIMGGEVISTLATDSLQKVG